MAHPDVLYPQPCPFCAIAQVYPPPRPPPALWHDEHDPALLSTYVPSLAALPSASTSDDAGADAQLGKRQVEAQKLTPPAYVLLSAPGVLAFLDIMPLSYGHVLVATREHRRTLAEVRSNTEGREIGESRDPSFFLHPFVHRGDFALTAGRGQCKGSGCR